MTLAQATDVEDRPESRTGSMAGRRYRTLADLALVAGAALAFRLPAVGFGLPAMLHPDEPTNIAVAGRMAADGTWNPHFFSYPSLMFDVEALADRAVRLVTGHAVAPGDFLSQGIGVNWTARPHMVFGLRLITVALSVGICLLVYGVVRRVTGRRWVAVASGLLAATSPLLVTNGVFVTPDTYSAFFTTVTLATALAVVRRGSRLDYVLAGVAVGLAAGSKYNVVAVLPVVVAHVLRERRGLLRPRALVPLGFAAVAAAAAFVLSTPAALFDTSSMIAGLKVELTHYSTGHPGAQGGSFGFYLRALVHDQAVLLPGAALAVVGAWFGRFRKEVVVVGVFAAANFGLIASETVRFDRDLLPLLPALILLTGFGVAWVAELVAGRWAGTQAAVVTVAAVTTVLVAGVLTPAAVGAVRVSQTLDEAPRTETVAWLDAHVPKGSSVVNENYGPWLDAGSYHLMNVSYVVSVALPADAHAIIVTEKGSGRFIEHARTYPNESAAYKKLLTRYCVAAKFSDGPWIEVLTPCR